MIIVKYPILGIGTSEIGAGFNFESNPKLIVWIWLGSDCSMFVGFKDIIVPSGVFHNHDYLEIASPMSDYLSSENMELKIEKWFVDTFAIVKKIMVNNPKLHWNVPFEITNQS